MRIRTIALALALACGLTATVEARTQKAPKSKRTYKAQKYKTPKYKPAKSPKVKRHA